MQRAFQLLVAVLSLPYEDSPAIGVPAPHVHTSDPLMASSEVHTVKVEEWCVRFFLSALYANNARDGEDGSSPTRSQQETPSRVSTRSAMRIAGAELLSLPQRLSVLRACMAAQDEQVLTQPRRRTRGQAPGHRGDGASFRFFFPPAKTSHAATSVRNASGGKDQLRIPYGLGKEFALQTIRDVMAGLDRACGGGKHGGDPGAGQRPLRPELYTELGRLLPARAVASLCSAILFFRLEGSEALQLLVAAAPVCAEAAGLLSGSEVASLLLCYATLRFHGNLPAARPGSSRVATAFEGTPNLYVILGTRAGELGDSLPVNDVVTVLRALELVDDKLDTTTLKAALESSLRMRRVRRPTQYDAL